jgi:hypothetical protein
VHDFQRHRLPLTGSLWDLRLLVGRRTKPTFSVFPVFSVVVMEKCCDACGDEDYCFWPGNSASDGAGISEASTANDFVSMGHTAAGTSSNAADPLCIFHYISCILHGGYGKVL